MDRYDYSALDTLLLEIIDSGEAHPMMLSDIKQGISYSDAWDDACANHLLRQKELPEYAKTPFESMLDSRLQKMRKEYQINYSREDGWMIL